jgi:pyruvate dehydrogenase E2 component (dihydrolipoamide acetyltransferase)
MASVVEMPRLSDTMKEGTLARWVSKLGDSIEPGDEFAEVETDKAVMTFESFDEGVLLALLIEEGDTVPLGTPIAILGEEGEDIAGVLSDMQAKADAGKAISEAGGPVDEKKAAAPAPSPEPEPVAAPVVAAPAPVASPEAQVASAPSAGVGADGIRIKASPLARRIAADKGIDLATVAGSGPQGRIIKRDLEGLDATRRVARSARRAPKEDTVVRASQMRKAIASRLIEAKQGAPHFYLNMTINCDRLVDFRRQLNASQSDVKLSYNDLVMRACVVALLDHPEVNAAWEGNQIRQFGGVHIGFAVALPTGLITPVVRNAEGKGLIEMAQEVRSLAGRARDQQLQPDEYTGNSFCVSNLGMFGIERFTAIINPPAACILAVGALREEPVVVDGNIQVGHTMTVSLSCDHRAVDGATGAQFLADLKHVIENPVNILEWN